VVRIGNATTPQPVKLVAAATTSIAANRRLTGKQRITMSRPFFWLERMRVTMVAR
jgi:hypothetical protein